MANWSDPEPSSPFEDLITQMKDRDVDAVTLLKAVALNLPTGAIRWNRATLRFQEWDGAAWQNLSLSAGIALGTMSQQDSDDVTITGGDISGATSVSVGNLTGSPIDPDRLGSGTKSGSSFLAGDSVYREPLPIGSSALWFTSAPPTGWLICDGTAISRTTYAALFSVLGTTYGVGDGSSTFNLPDLRGRFPFGRAASGTGSTLAGTFGVVDHTHTGPSHTHNYTQIVNHTHPVVIVDPGHDHDIQGSDDDPVVVAAGAGESPVNSGNTETENAFTGITATTSNPAGSVATGVTEAGGTGVTGLSNPPALTVNFIIKY